MDDFQRILRLFSTTGELAVSEVMDALQIPRSSSASRRMSELVKASKLIKWGQGKGTRYKIPPTH